MGIINSFTPEQKAVIESLWPYIETLTRKINEAPGDLCFTGFIYGGEAGHPMLLHLGNISDKGDNLVSIHYTLASMAADLEAAGLSDATEIKSAPEGSTPEEIADKLALTLLSDPLIEGSDRIKEVLQQYLAARAPRK